MRCPICREENPEPATTCQVCGAPLASETSSAAVTCPRCGTENPIEAAYCGSCGLDLVAARLEGGDQSLAPEAVALAHGEYMGFWIRLAAWGADTGILTVTQLLLTAGFGDLGAFGFVLSLSYYVLFTGLKGQTPGKMLVGIKVIDERGEVPGMGRALFREVPGKFISGIALGLGYVWAAWDDKKQAWHDKIAKTYVVRQVKGSGDKDGNIGLETRR